MTDVIDFLINTNQNTVLHAYGWSVHFAWVLLSLKINSWFFSVLPVLVNGISFWSHSHTTSLTDLIVSSTCHKFESMYFQFLVVVFLTFETLPWKKMCQWGFCYLHLLLVLTHYYLVVPLTYFKYVLVSQQVFYRLKIGWFSSVLIKVVLLTCNGFSAINCLRNCYLPTHWSTHYQGDEVTECGLSKI